MDEIVFLDRKTLKKEVEKVYKGKSLAYLYSDSLFSRMLLPALCKNPAFSRLYGLLQKSRMTQKKVQPFIDEFGLDTSEFLSEVSEYGSFNDFFIRKLKPEARSIVPGKDVAILPADGRYLVYPNIDLADGFLVKGQKFSLESFLQDKELAAKYSRGSMVIARLCPTDYHRFHFPFHCIPSKPNLINGYLYSVNPVALKRNIEIFSENKREVTLLRTQPFGEVLFIEVGATCVGAIHQTFTPFEPYAKGEEKGYFSFGGSSLVMLFEPGVIQFDQDLIDASAEKMEVRGHMGQSLGRSLRL